MPEGDGPWPVVLARTPYNKGGSARGARRYVDNGYVYAVQDQRGRFRSQGEYRPHENEIRDGYDTVEWIAVQAWSNGRVGMTGGSALGIAGNLAAAADPPHLRAAYFSVAPRSLFYEGRFVGGLVQGGGHRRMDAWPGGERGGDYRVSKTGGARQAMGKRRTSSSTATTSTSRFTTPVAGTTSSDSGRS